MVHNANVPTDAERLCRQAYDRYSAGDFDGLLELFAEDVEVYVAPPNFESGTYTGHAQYRGLIERWGTAWDKMRIEVMDMESEGDWILALVHYIGCGKGSGVEITQPSWELSLWTEGLCRRYFVYWDEKQGRRAFEDCAAGRRV
jgi:ketosteroid isomerase-like protein